MHYEFLMLSTVLRPLCFGSDRKDIFQLLISVLRERPLMFIKINSTLLPFKFWHFTATLRCREILGYRIVLLSFFVSLKSEGRVFFLFFSLIYLFLSSVWEGIAVLEGPMYAVGGHDGWSYLNTVERWDPQARQWNYVASMSTPRSTVGVTALNGK